MAHLEENSDKFKNLNSRWYVRFLVWLLLGKGKGKTTYNELLEKGRGNPIRWSGVVVAGLLVLSLVGARYFLSGPILKRYLKAGLERANGATVDVGDFKLDLGTGDMSVSNLAMADPNALDTDLLRAAQLTAKVSTTDLLRKRFQMDQVIVSDASQGEKRATKAKRVGPAPKPLPDPSKKPGDKTLDDYLKQAQVWKDRLAQARKWLDKLSSHKGTDKGTDQTPAQKPETLQERLEREIRESGYTHVQASHLVQGAPRFLLKELQIKKLRVPFFGDETVDINAHDLSTDPNLLAAIPTVKINTSKQTLDLLVALAGSSATGGQNTINLTYANLSADAFAKNLIGGSNVLKGGTINFTTNGTWQPGSVNLPLQITLNNTAVAGQKVPKLDIPLGVTGPLDSPHLFLDPDAIMKAVATAAIGGVTDKFHGELDKQTGKIGGNAGKILGGKTDDLLGGLTGQKPTTKPK